MVLWLEVFLMILFVAALADAATRRYPPFRRSFFVTAAGC